MTAEEELRSRSPTRAATASGLAKASQPRPQQQPVGAGQGDELGAQLQHLQQQQALQQDAITTLQQLQLQQTHTVGTHAQELLRLDAGLRWTRSAVEREQTEKASRQLKVLCHAGDDTGQMEASVLRLAQRRGLWVTASSAHGTPRGPIIVLTMGSQRARIEGIASLRTVPYKGDFLKVVRVMPEHVRAADEPVKVAQDTMDEIEQGGERSGAFHPDWKEHVLSRRATQEPVVVCSWLSPLKCSVELSPSVNAEMFGVVFGRRWRAPAPAAAAQSQPADGHRTQSTRADVEIIYGILSEQRQREVYEALLAGDARAAGKGGGKPAPWSAAKAAPNAVAKEKPAAKAKATAATATTAAASSSKQEGTEGPTAKVEESGAEYSPTGADAAAAATPLADEHMGIEESAPTGTAAAGAAPQPAAPSQPQPPWLTAGRSRIGAKRTAAQQGQGQAPTAPPPAANGSSAAIADYARRAVQAQLAGPTQWQGFQEEYEDEYGMLEDEGDGIFAHEAEQSSYLAIERARSQHDAMKGGGMGMGTGTGYYGSGGGGGSDKGGGYNGGHGGKRAGKGKGGKGKGPGKGKAGKARYGYGDYFAEDAGGYTNGGKQKGGKGKRGRELHAW